MNGLRKINSFIRARKYKRKARKCVYIYTPLPSNKFGYIIEYRRPEFSEIFYYKYKKNADNTLTKYGYLVSDPGISFGHKNSNRIENNENKGLWTDKDKDCIFYQTFADKTQIELEYRWMNEIRNKVLEKFDSNCVDNNMNLSTQDPESKDHQRPQLKTVDLPISQSKTSDDKQSSNADEFSPPITPITPPSSPSEMYSTGKQNCLLNMNIKQRHKRIASKDSAKSISSKNSQTTTTAIKPRKLVHLTHPKFSRNPPMVHTFDPEDSLIFKNCKCEHCIIGQYNE
ncbi:9134_t:CDS:2 [Racocetra persica]|uniref:9134_t:CDS:1 n=1 Tax=Racocetra persica TaxID=160502 RepID=A0ACA9L920_9GLOM|nr:9134_t:CDS:2 [Racocetra persica]